MGFTRLEKLSNGKLVPMSPGAKPEKKDTKKSGSIMNEENIQKDQEQASKKPEQVQEQKNDFEEAKKKADENLENIKDIIKKEDLPKPFGIE